MTPGELDAALRDVPLATLRGAIDRSCFELSAGRAWLGLLRALVTLAAGETVLWMMHGFAATVVGSVVSMLGLFGLFVISHDCGHLAFSRRRWVSFLVGHVCMSICGNSFHGWRLAHDHHHGHAQLRGHDTDWAERMPTRAEYERSPWHVRMQHRLAYGSVVGVLLAFPVSMVRRTFMRALYPQVALSRQARRQLAGSNLVLLAVLVGITGGLHAWGGWAAVARHYGVPMYLGMLSGALVTLLHHSSEEAFVYEKSAWTPVRGQVVGTFDVRLPAWLETIVFHINRHVPHHLAPRIPWYHLPRASASLEAAWPALRQTRRFSLRYLARIWSAPLLEPAGPGVYRTAPVRAQDSSRRSAPSESTVAPGA